MIRGKRRKDRRRILLTIVWIAVVGLGATGLFALGKYQSDYAHRQQANATLRTEGASRECYAVLRWTFCASNDKAAEADAERAEQDLQAQQDMAEWAKWITFLTAAQIGIGSFGLWGLWLTLKATRKGNRIARESAERQLRAYVQTECGGVEIDDKTIVVKIRLKNSGQTPAYRIAYRTHIFIAPALTQEGEAHIWQKVDQQPLSETDGVIGAEATYGQGMQSEITTEQVKALAEAAASGVLPVYVAGRIYYFDTFNRKRQTNFLHFYEPGKLGEKDGKHHLRGNSAT